jgi:hypothetical protein
VIAVILIFALIGVVFGVRQSISHCDTLAILATVAVSRLFALWSKYYKALMPVLALLDKLHCYEHPNSFGQPEFADKLL